MTVIAWPLDSLATAASFGTLGLMAGMVLGVVVTLSIVRR